MLLNAKNLPHIVCKTNLAAKLPRQGHRSCVRLPFLVSCFVAKGHQRETTLWTVPSKKNSVSQNRNIKSPQGVKGWFPAPSQATQKTGALAGKPSLRPEVGTVRAEGAPIFTALVSMTTKVSITSRSGAWYLLLTGGVDGPKKVQTLYQPLK